MTQPADSADLRVLRVLENSPERTQREVANELGMSVGKVNYILRALLRKGLVKFQRFRANPNKRGYAYLLTPAGISAKATLTRQFLEAKTREYEALKLEIERLRQETDGVEQVRPSETGAPTRLSSVETDQSRARHANPI